MCMINLWGWTQSNSHSNLVCLLFTLWAFLSCYIPKVFYYLLYIVQQSVRTKCTQSSTLKYCPHVQCRRKDQYYIRVLLVLALSSYLATRTEVTMCCTAQPEDCMLTIAILWYVPISWQTMSISHRAYIMCACACISLKMQTHPCADSTGMLHVYIHVLCVWWYM